MPKETFVPPLVAALLLAGPLAAELPLKPTEAMPALVQLRAQRGELGLGPLDDFLIRTAYRDELGWSHVRFQQTFQGVPVWGGEAITHVDADGRPQALTDGLVRGIGLDVLPSLTPSEALGLAKADLAPRGGFAYPPTATLVVDALKTRRDAPAAGCVLAYHVHTQLENGTLETAHTDYLIDAHTGAILKKWDSLRTKAALGTGLTQYDGKVTLNTTATAKGFALRDQTRGKGGTFGNNVVTNLDHGSSGDGALYFNATNTWGDGANYTGGDTSTTGATGQTAAADAAYGTQVTWDMYKRVFGRDGIDGTGKATFGRVHYSTSYENAFWDDTCFCMTYGDGDQLKSLEALDVAGHEMAHGVCSATANLTYSGESGGLNEANSDILGTMAEFYAKGGGFAAGAKTIPDTGGNWTLGEQVSSAPVRYMYKPSKDGSSLDAWTDDLGDLDVHFSSGPMNRCFYFLSQGASAKAGDLHSDYLPSGMTGLGNQRSARIWYRALTAYLQADSDYTAARAATIRAAKDLYGAGSEAEQAAWRAFHGINVGPDWKPTKTGPITATIGRPASDLSVASGTRVAFEGSGRDTHPGTSLSYHWDFGDGGKASGATASHTFTNPGAREVQDTVTFTVTDSQGATGTATRVVTVLPTASQGPDLIRNGGFEEGANGWSGDTSVIGAAKDESAHAGRQYALFSGGGIPSKERLYQTVTIPADAHAATLTFQLLIDTTELLDVPSDYCHVQVLSGTDALLKDLATYDNTQSAPGYQLRTFDLTAFKGQRVRINLQVTQGWLFHTAFAVDDVSLTVN